MNLGMMRNGLSQTLNITYRKTGKGSLSSVLEKEVDEKYYLSRAMFDYVLRHQPDLDNNNHANTVQTRQGQMDSNYSSSKNRIRRLTPLETERLQGFPDDFTKSVSDTQRYKMMGNAVSVPVVEAIGKKILGVINEV
jgi:DNA (cytosine-5)-methyltransferase 1